MRELMFIMLLAGCGTPYKMTVISVTDSDTKHCIQNNAIICEYTAK